MIRQGNFGDVAALARFDLFGGSRVFDAADGRLHVFENSDGGIVAYVSTAEYLFHGFPYVSFLAVRDDHHRKGIATELLHHVERLNAGQRLFISVESDNEPMISLLEKERFTRSGALSGLNDSHSGVDEIFYFKDVSESRPQH